MSFLPCLEEPSLFSQARKAACERASLSEIRLAAPLGGCVNACSDVLPENCVLLPFSKAFSIYGTVLTKSFMNDVELEKDPSFLFSLAAHKEGFFIYIPPGERVETLSLEHVLREHEAALATRVQVVLGKGAELNLYETFRTGKDSCCMTSMNCEVDSGGKLAVHSCAEAKSLVTSYRVVLKDNAACVFTSAQEASFSKSSFSCVLQGKESSLSYADFSHVACGCHSERFSSVEHKAPATSSEKYVKKVVAGGGASRYTGKVILSEQSQQACSKQMHRALTLDPSALCYSSPMFDVFQNEAQATHGSTIAPLDEKMLFYMETRGVKGDEAKKLLMQAFCDDVFRLFPSPTRVQLEAKIT